LLVEQINQKLAKNLGKQEVFATKACGSAISPDFAPDRY
jgi:hypothetical protein